MIVTYDFDPQNSSGRCFHEYRIPDEEGDRRLAEQGYPGYDKSPVIDDRTEQDKARSKSTPMAQFESQCIREYCRLIHQHDEKAFGRRQTIPFNNNWFEFRSNAENNVRNHWIEQGIWADEWGPVFDEENAHGHRDGSIQDDSWFGSHSPVHSQLWVATRWGHEEKLESEPEPKQPNPSQQIPSLEVRGAEQTVSLEDYEEQLPLPRLTLLNREACRPRPQFEYQKSKERKWLRDEIKYKMPREVVDLDTLAHESVRNNWIEDGIWNPEWGKEPGMMWNHEEEEDDEKLREPWQRKWSRCLARRSQAGKSEAGGLHVDSDSTQALGGAETSYEDSDPMGESMRGFPNNRIDGSNDLLGPRSNKVIIESNLAQGDNKDLFAPHPYEDTTDSNTTQRGQGLFGPRPSEVTTNSNSVQGGQGSFSPHPYKVTNNINPVTRSFARLFEPRSSEVTAYSNPVQRDQGLFGPRPNEATTESNPIQRDQGLFGSHPYSSSAESSPADQQLVQRRQGLFGPHLSEVTTNSYPAPTSRDGKASETDGKK